MFQKYAPLIKARIKGFRIKPWNFDDFLQEGLLVLYKAVQTYKMDSRKTFNKYFDMILQRRYMQILRKESRHFYNVELVGTGSYLMETIPSSDRRMKEEDFTFSAFEKQVAELCAKRCKPKDISLLLECTVKQVYDAKDRIRKKLKGAENSLDKYV
jgi:RNA polymerase sporulation-specific sigma factor